MADYYQILGINRSASKDDIGKAYRKLAKKYHPDLHPDDKNAKVKFQEVQQAFDVLNDDNKRKMYDQFGPDFENRHTGGGTGGYGGYGGGGYGGYGGYGDGHGGGFPGGFPGGGTWEFDLNDVFHGTGFNEGRNDFDSSDIFGTHGPGFGGGSRRRWRTPVKGNDLQRTQSISFAESVLGCEMEVRIQNNFGEVKTVTAKIPAGIEDGKKLRLAGLGESSPNGGPAGDLVLTVTIQPHPFFTRQGKDLILRLPVTISEAVLGAKVSIPTPKGEGFLNIPAGTSSGKKFRVKGGGVQLKSGAGDLLVELMIHVPPTISTEEAELLRNLDSQYVDNLRAGITW